MDLELAGKLTSSSTPLIQLVTHSCIVVGKFFHLGTNSHQQNETQRYSQPDNLTLTWTKVFSKLPTVQYTTIKHAAILIHQSSIPSCVSVFPPSINYKLKTKITRRVQNSSLVTQSSPLAILSSNYSGVYDTVFELQTTYFYTPSTQPITLG